MENLARGNTLDGRVVSTRRKSKSIPIFGIFCRNLTQGKEVAPPADAGAYFIEGKVGLSPKASLMNMSSQIASTARASVRRRNVLCVAFQFFV